MEYLEAVRHLPAGAILVFQHVTWEQYEALVEDLVDRPGVRVHYDEGKLEIMTPLPEHEQYKEFIYSLARAVSEELRVPLETRGSATWKRRDLSKGVEPDTCFYVENAPRIIGKRTIDLTSDPPPDVVVEVDTTNESLSKFPICAALGVPEIWRYDGARAHIYELAGAAYVETTGSRFFPGLTAVMLTDSLESSKTRGQTDALTAFRERIRGLH
jgi:Uma2 family endonuclease